MNDDGQALVELALSLPLLLALAMGIALLAEVGVARLTLEQAAAEGARAGALTNDDARIRATIAAAVRPLDAARVRVEIDPAEGLGDRAREPRGALLSVRLEYPIVVPFGPFSRFLVRGSAARRIEWSS